MGISLRYDARSGRRRLPQPGLRRQAAGYLRALLSVVDHKNSWQLAEHPGQDKPLGLQRLLSRASWDADVLRDELIRYAGEHLGVHNAVLIVDETGFLKKGTKSVPRRRSIEVCFESAKQHTGLDEYEVRS